MPKQWYVVARVESGSQDEGSSLELALGPLEAAMASVKGRRRVRRFRASKGAPLGGVMLMSAGQAESRSDGA